MEANHHLEPRHGYFEVSGHTLVYGNTCPNLNLRVQPLTDFISDLVLKADVEKAMFEYAEEVRRVVYPRPRDDCGEYYERRVEYKRDVEAAMIRWDRQPCLKRALEERRKFPF